MTQPGCENALRALVSRIKQSANLAGINTVRDMALASGVSKSGVDKIYNMKSYPCFDTLLAMAAACGTHVHQWVFNLEQDSDSKGKRPEPDSKPSKPEPEPKSRPKRKTPSKRKPRGQNRNSNGKYECWKCGKEHDTVRAVKACYASHRDDPKPQTMKEKHPKPEPQPEPSSTPQPEPVSKAGKKIDLVAMLHGMKPE